MASPVLPIGPSYTTSNPPKKLKTKEKTSEKVQAVAKFCCLHPSCTKTFSSNFGLREHRKEHRREYRIVTGVIPHLCPHTTICGKRFASAFYLQKHLADSHPDLPV